MGRIHLIIVRQTGSRMHMPSTVRTRPAPREIQTEYCSVFRPASLGSLSCLYLYRLLATTGTQIRGPRPGHSIPSKREQAPVDTPEDKGEEKLRRLQLLQEKRPETHIGGGGGCSSSFSSSSIRCRPATEWTGVVDSGSGGRVARRSSSSLSSSSMPAGPSRSGLFRYYNIYIPTTATEPGKRVDSSRGK